MGWEEDDGEIIKPSGTTVTIVLSFSAPNPEGENRGKSLSRVFSRWVKIPALSLHQGVKLFLDGWEKIYSSHTKHAHVHMHRHTHSHTSREMMQLSCHMEISLGR